MNLLTYSGLTILTRSLPLLTLLLCLEGLVAAEKPDNPKARLSLRANLFSQSLLAIDDLPASTTDPEAQLLQELFQKSVSKAAAPDEKARRALRAQVLEEELAALEEFVDKRPSSSWTPSLRAHLGHYYQKQGRYTLALEHWPRAWQATKDIRQGAGRAIADYTLAFWTRLLMALGHNETLEALLTQTQGRVLESGPLQQMLNRTREAWVKMRRNPQGHKCGTLALEQVGRVLQGKAFKSKGLLELNAPPAGFSLQDLAELSEQAALGLVAVERPGGQEELVVPSLVHYKQNHYGAIVARRGEFYQVEDLTAGHALFLKAQAINAEASGNFLVPEAQVPSGWAKLTPAQAVRVVGRSGSLSIYQRLQDENDQLCLSCLCPPGGSEEAGCCGGGELSAVGGMPRWRVSEPYLNLWLVDEPLAYRPALGQRVSFQWSYKQRDEELNFDPGIYSLGNGVSFSWFSYLYTEQPEVQVDVFLSGGGKSHFIFDESGRARNYYNNLELKVLKTGPGAVYGYELFWPDGSRDIYDFARSTEISSWSQMFLSRRIDPQGRVSRFNYALYNPATRTVRLDSVTDPDGRTNFIAYDNRVTGYPNLITSVSDPFGRVARFAYNAEAYLTQVTDVGGLASSIGYNSLGWPVSLTTPYGTTSFASVDLGSQSTASVDRSISITQPNSARQIYAFVENCSAFMPLAYTDNLPSGTPLASFDNEPWTRNSFYWDGRQSVGLPGSVDQFEEAHFLKARLRHWLGGAAGAIDTLAIERQGSPDGVAEGQKTWYDYANKPSPDQRGEQILPAVVAQVLPDNSTRYLSFERNGWGKPRSITSTYGTGSLTRTYSFNYSTDGVDLLEERGPDPGLLRSYSYNGLHQVLRVNEVVDSQTTYLTTYSYDPATGQLASIGQPNGVTTTLGYDAQRRLSQVTQQPMGRVNTFTYWDNGLPYKHTDPRGLERTFYWDNLQRLIQIGFPGGTYIEHTYNRLDRVATKDRLGYWTRFNYNSLGQLTSAIDPLNRTNTYTYCSCGVLESITNPLNQTTRFFYDLQGNRTNIVHPGNWAQNFEYNLLGQLVRTKDHSGSTIGSYTYNNQGLLTSISNAYGQTMAISYDSKDRPVSVSSAGGPSTTQAFDELGRLTNRVVAGGGTESFAYSAQGLVSWTDPLLRTSRYQYDLVARQITFINAKGETSRLIFNPAGDLVNLIDGKGQTTTWNYDSSGRLSNKVDPAGSVTSFSYDANHRLTYRWTPAKGSAFYYYDGVGNLTYVDYANSPDTSYSYDALNRLTSLYDWNTGATTFSYTASGLLQNEDGPWPNDTLSSSYNSNGQRSGLALLLPSGLTHAQSYTYDLALRLARIDSPAGAFTYTYQGASPRVASLALPGGALITSAFDPLGRLTQSALRSSSGALLNSHSYTYNNLDQRTRHSRSHSYVDYSYDNIGQLTSALGYEPSSGLARAHERFSYTYDSGANLTRRENNALVQSFAFDNRLNQVTSASVEGSLTLAGLTAHNATSVTVNGQAASLYADGSFASANQPISGTFNATAQGPGSSASDTLSVSFASPAYFYYDLNGNLASDGARSYSYDDENQLIQVTVHGVGRTTFGYDGLGRRRWKREYNLVGALQQEVRYLYDGLLVVQERDGNNQLLATYTRGLDLSGTREGAGGIGGLLARTDANGSSAFYHSDGSGNVTALVNSSQQVVARYLYDPFGSLIGLSGPLAEANLYRFSSKEYHPTSGLYYYGFRYYEPNLQRWINRDPIGEQGGVNLYEFVGNNPIDSIDSFGLFKSQYHRSITVNALKNSGLSQKFIDIIAQANVDQDDGAVSNSGPFADSLNHGDNNRIRETIDQMRQRMSEVAQKRCTSPGDAEELLRMFGRILHALQDLYSHSNYIEMFGNDAAKPADIPIWQMWNGDGTANVPPGVITGAYKWPLDNGRGISHAQLNKDAPGSLRGSQVNKNRVSLFRLAEQAATQHSANLWQDVVKQLTPEQKQALFGH